MPMTKCGGCGKFTSPADAARCTKCNAYYHRVCVGLAGKGTVPSSWQCPECRKNGRRENKTETLVRSYHADVQTGAPPSVPAESPVLESTYSEEPTEEDPATSVTVERMGHGQQINVASQLRVIMEELRSLRHEVLELRKELKSSSDTCNGRMNTIEKRLQALEEWHADVPVDAAAVGGVLARNKAGDLARRITTEQNIQEIIGQYTVWK